MLLAALMKSGKTLCEMKEFNGHKNNGPGGDDDGDAAGMVDVVYGVWIASVGLKCVLKVGVHFFRQVWWDTPPHHLNVVVSVF